MSFRARFRVGPSCGLPLLLCAVVLGTLGCTNDGDAFLRAPESLAVGAYGPLQIGDGCSGGKLDLCSNEQVASIGAVSVANPSVAEVLPLDALPSELAAFDWPEGQRLLHGLAAGTTSVCVTARFSDGSDRKGCANVTVGVPDELVVLPVCGSSTNLGNGEPTFVTPGTDVSFGVELRAKGSPLGGVVVDPLENTEPTRLGLMSYRWSSPATGGLIDLRSTHAPGSVERLETYEPGAVDALHAEVSLPAPHALYPGETLEGSLEAAIGGVVVCESFATTASSDTPDVCLGPAGETSWTGGTRQVVLSAVATGTCRLSLGVVGGSGTVGTLETPILVLDPADEGREADVNEACEPRGMTSCAHSRRYQLVCGGPGAKSYWTLGTPCEDRLCTFTAPAGECTGPGCAECR